MGGYYYPVTSAWSGWNTTTISSSSTLTAVMPNYPTVAAAQREKTPLEWLDAEVERVCELAR